MNFIHIAARVASRADVLPAIDQAFSNVGAYPPVMKSLGQNEYEGQIDGGWILWVKELSSGKLEVELNSHSIADLDAAAQAYKKKDPKYAVIGSVPSSKAPAGPPDFDKTDVYCLWGFGDEPGGEVEREWHVQVWDLPDGSHFIRAEKTKGPDMDVTGTVSDAIPSGVVEALVDSDWRNANSKLTGPNIRGANGLLGYLLSNAEHPAAEKNLVHY